MTSLSQEDLNEIERMANTNDPVILSEEDIETTGSTLNRYKYHEISYLDPKRKYVEGISLSLYSLSYSASVSLYSQLFSFKISSLAIPRLHRKVCRPRKIN